MKTKYTKELLEPIIKSSKSMRNVLTHLGLGYTGGNFSYIKKIITKYNISIQHFEGYSYQRGKISVNRKNPNDYLVLYEENKYPHTHQLKKRMIRDGVKEEECEICKNKKWMGKPISLELHHIDGHKENCVLENLKLLCPNCHSQTDNYSIRNRIKHAFLEEAEIKNTCVDCGKEISRGSKRCRQCESNKRKPLYSDEDLEEKVKRYGVVGASKEYGVSHTTVRRWLNKEKTKKS